MLTLTQGPGVSIVRATPVQQNAHSVLACLELPAAPAPNAAAGRSKGFAIMNTVFELWQGATEDTRATVA